MANIFKDLSLLDKHINDNEPWAIKEADKLKEVLTYEVNELRRLALCLEPFIPNASMKIQSQFNSIKIESQTGLFPRI